ncbi:hypothetical protein [Streptomyces sp. NPDC052036]|uniref:hypothetical protein n=1 Tax=Streptomyces sp. NPDC052036 TaxID=3155171 RepID=UPI00342312F5
MLIGDPGESAIRTGALHQRFAVRGIRGRLDLIPDRREERMQLMRDDEPLELPRIRDLLVEATTHPSPQTVVSVTTNDAEPMRDAPGTGFKILPWPLLTYLGSPYRATPSRVASVRRSTTALPVAEEPADPQPDDDPARAQRPLVQSAGYVLGMHFACFRQCGHRPGRAVDTASTTRVPKGREEIARLAGISTD